MAGCVRPALLKCMPRSRLLSDISFLKKGAPVTSDIGHLLDLGAVHKEWKAAGHFPRAPAHIIKHGTKCLQSLSHHNNLPKDLFNDVEYRLFALAAKHGGKELDFGTLVSPTEAAVEPEIGWSYIPVKADKKYTVVLVSPDCTNCTIHWCASNITPPDVTMTPRDVTMTTLLPYIPPVPLKGTGFYRYAIVLLEQPNKATTEPTNEATDSALSPLHRSSTLAHFVEEENMTPVGLAFYQSCWDESVGRVLAGRLDLDEKQYCVERAKRISEFYAEQRFMDSEWQMRTGFM